MRAAGAAGVIAALLATTAACSGSGEADPEPTASGVSDASNQVEAIELTDGTTKFRVATNPDGPDLSTGLESGVEFLSQGEGEATLTFKDMDGDGVLAPWEDWRLPAAERAADLAPRLSIEQLSGLMLFSTHQNTPRDGLSAAQREYLSTARLRTVLHAGPSDIEPSVTWANELQAYAESLATHSEPYLPVTITSDPRSDARDSFTGAQGVVSQWPSSLGLAATSIRSGWRSSPALSQPSIGGWG